jgi:predicted  nucleic acid-binding Zn-ribbon protein
MANTADELPSSPVASLADEQLRKRLSGASSVAIDHKDGVRVSSYSIDCLSRPRTRNLTSNQQSDDEQDDDREDTFEDAQDTASLRSRTLTSKANAVEAKDDAPAVDDHVSSESDSDEEDDDEGGQGKEHDTDHDVHSDDGSLPDKKPDATAKTAINEPKHDDVEAVQGADDVLPDNRSEGQFSSQSISGVSNMDNVNLDDDAVPSSDRQNTDAAVTATAPAGSTEEEGAEQPAEQLAAPPKPPPKPSKTLSLGSFTSALPSLSWGSSSQTPAPTPTPASEPAAKSPSISSATNVPATTTPIPPLPPAVAPPPTRKITSPFAWLSRSSTTKETPPPPPQPAPRRNTTSSMATMTSNPELMLGRLTDDKDADSTHNFNPVRNSLKDRFQQLRQQSEIADATSPTEDSVPPIPGSISLSASVNLGLASPPNEEDKDQGLSAKPPLSPVPPSPNPSLAPGTAVGVESGPSAMNEGNVDWDLWQSVVYEGPAAVARSSAEELNRAIATGIPSAIRGVVWQVLAQSKNEDLEIVYRELSARGTDKAKERRSHSTTASTASNGQASIQSDTQITSSVSSITEEAGVDGSPVPPEKVSEAVQKAQAAADAERKRKEKEDAATLQRLEKTIRRDMGTRTSYSKYAAAEGLQDGLFGVCKAYALFDEEVSYAQGMNFLVMPLLFNMPEEEAFCLLVRLMNHYGLRELFINDMPGLHMRLYQFERLLEDFEPALYCHLHRRHISPHLYATQWFLTLFAYRFPLQLVLRIYDLIFSEGLSAILRFGLVLMQKNASTLLAMHDMQQLTTFLKDKVFDVYIDKAPSAGSLLENGFFGSSSSSLDKEVYHADQMVRDACEIRITPKMLKSYTIEWEEKTKAERDRGAELENLRSSNANYAHRLRKLEERIEAVDLEQAQLATDLVHTKVLNQELTDENEGLRGQVRELRVVIEKQPAEIESVWQAERDDLMKRNGNVHEENQRLEKEMLELEEELVQTKMTLAELNSQHEALNRKWGDLKRQFA